jgi:ornithine decarboxylase
MANRGRHGLEAIGTGIVTVIPGERLVERARPMIEYLFEQAANRFPGCENEVQGLYGETGVDGTIRFHTYVVRE